MVQNISGTQGLVGIKVGMVHEGPNVDVEGMYSVFPSVSLH